MKIDPYKHKENYLKWKKECKDKIPSLSKENSDLLLNYLRDMEIGINVASESKKGARSSIRLISLKNKLIFMMRKLNELYSIDNITKAPEEKLFNSTSY